MGKHRLTLNHPQAATQLGWPVDEWYTPKHAAPEDLGVCVLGCGPAGFEALDKETLTVVPFCLDCACYAERNPAYVLVN